MIQYAVLGSGSSGNSYLFSYNGSSLLVDAGFSLKELNKRALSLGFSLESVDALCITHLHPDHSRGSGVFARKMGKPVYFHQQLIDDQRDELEKLKIPSTLLCGFTPKKTFRVGTFSVTPFTTSHDADHSVSFSLEVEGRIFTVLTDTGKITQTHSKMILQSDVIFLEANYESALLENGPYSPALKRRIASSKGHLSNEQAIECVNNLALSSGVRLYLCHLSETNNHPSILQQRCAKSLEFSGLTTICHHGAMYKDQLALKEGPNET